VIYGVDPEEYDGLDMRTRADPGKLAKQVLLNDPYSGFGPEQPGRQTNRTVKQHN